MAGRASKIIRAEFPHLDEDIYTYLEGVLDGGIEEFENNDDIYEAIGGVLHDVAAHKDENEIRSVCEKMLALLKPGGVDGTKVSNSNQKKLLGAPVVLSDAGDFRDAIDNSVSIWSVSKGDELRVDAKKLEKAEAKIAQKQVKKSQDGPKSSSNGEAPEVALATASQALSKKDSRMDAKGTSSNSMDIHIDNFDISYGDRCLLTGAELHLAQGRRYGLVGRNGLGKTTLLRMIASKSLRIPPHITVLHVEQEVVGDDTPALQSVLECDFKRESLLNEEKELQAQIASGNTDPNISARLTSVYAELEACEAAKAPARASVILHGLGFSAAAQIRPTREFSGGWRMRLALARALFSKPDLLLLDEPTNMLDMKAIIWLEDYLSTWPSTLLVVSHDRQFLESVPTDIILMHSQRLEVFKGNYEVFLKTRSERHKQQAREYEAQAQLRAHVQEFIDKFRYNAKRASLVQSKIKFLEKLPVLQPVEKESEVTLRFAEVEPLSPPALRLDELCFGYTSGKPILVKVDLSASSESRICIVGENGAGKTTLLKLLIGDLEPTSGLRHAHRSLRLGYFSQHHVDQLDLSLCPIAVMQSKFPGKPVEEYRRMLGSFGVTGDLALQTIASLSGGQKSRVAFAIMAAARPNFLILDEPTNHLDIESIEALGKAINNFQGGVVLVSHDERLIRMVCKELWVCAGGKVYSLEGGFDQYRRLVQKELAEL